jgi:hypothetical protein
VKIKLLTQWRDKEIVCCCPLINRCRKDHNCEELMFTLDPPFNKQDILECFKNDEKKR